MNRLLRPSWVALHVLVAVALVVMVRLGLWQWGRGVDSGALRNYSYGLEWWAFAVLTVVGWWRFCVDETRAPADEAEPEQQQNVHQQPGRAQQSGPHRPDATRSWQAAPAGQT